MSAPFPRPLSIGTGNILPNSQFLSNIAAYVAGDVSLPRLIHTLLSPLLPLSPPSGIDQWTYSWPQNFGTGHKLHKTKPNQTGQAEEAAMKCIAMRLSFISCGQRAGGAAGAKGRKRVQICATHTQISDFRSMCHAPYESVSFWQQSKKELSQKWIQGKMANGFGWAKISNSWQELCQPE